MSDEAEPPVPIEEHHARVWLWRVIHDLPPGATLVLGRVSPTRCEAALVRPMVYNLRVKGSTWEQTLRKLGLQATSRFVTQEPSK
jgi:hypothetical protein